MQPITEQFPTIRNIETNQPELQVFDQSIQDQIKTFQDNCAPDQLSDRMVQESIKLTPLKPQEALIGGDLSAIIGNVVEKEEETP